MNLIKRTLSEKFNRYLRLFPVVAIIGPRQAGKTTFAKMELPDWQYFDLEKPSDLARISSDVEFFLNHYGDRCIIDEAQVFPDLFPAIRSHIDNARRQKGRIVLLGSVNPLLMKNISESLAGRIGFIEIAPLSYAEAEELARIGLEEFWLKGGYPEPVTWDNKEHTVWTEQYVKTFVERDVFKTLKTSFSSQSQMQLLRMLAHCHAKLWNSSQIASALGVSYHTINHYVGLMENYFLVRRLTPYYQNIGKRIVKSPKFYYRDTGLLHYLLNITDIEALRISPYRGFSFEGFVIEQLIQKCLLVADSHAGFYFYRTAQGDEIDLLVQTEHQLLAYEIKTSTSIALSELAGFQRSLKQLNLDRGVVVYFGNEDFRLNQQIEVKSVNSILKAHAE